MVTAIAPCGTEPVVRIRELTFGYRTRTVFRDFNLDLRAGMNFVVGLNGAGKTTLFRLLLGDLTGRRGTVEVHGTVEATGTPGSTRPAGIGYLPQSFGFPPRFTVTEFVMHFAWLRGVARGSRREYARTAIERVGLTGHAQDRMGTLSGGMLRRAGIAQAIVHQPKLVLLDEPTVGLDPRQRVGLRTLFTTMATDTTLVVSTHLLEDVAAVGGNVSVLDEGELRFTGPVADMARLGSDEPGLDAAFLALTGAGALA